MKKFEFRLQKVLDVKKINLTKEQRDLASVENQRLRAFEEMKKSKSMLDNYCLKMDSDKCRKASEMKFNYDYLYNLMDNLKSQKLNLKNFEKKVEEARTRLIAKQRECKILSCLKEKHFQKYQNQVQNEEQGVLDEIALNGNRRILNS